MEYDVIQTTSLDSLIEKVNARLAERWDLLGSLQVMRCGNGLLYIRELVRYKKQYAPDSDNVWMMEPVDAVGVQ
jgi:hypothetical protein